MNPLSIIALLALAAGATAVRDKVCAVNVNGEVKTYDNTHLKIFESTTAKSLLTRWDEINTDPCKFRARIVPRDGQVSWTAFSVGVHKNSKKFWRNFAFERFRPERVEIRGWNAKSDLSDLDLPYQFVGGATEATLYGDYTNGYVINSTTCPGFEFRYIPGAPADQGEVMVSIDSSKYQTAGDALRGMCQNANDDKDDDYRLCRTLVDVQSSFDALEQISGSCYETDGDIINI